jgi:hypothetical protein
LLTHAFIFAAASPTVSRTTVACDCMPAMKKGLYAAHPNRNDMLHWQSIMRLVAPRHSAPKRASAVGSRDFSTSVSHDQGLWCRAS